MRLKLPHISLKWFAFGQLSLAMLFICLVSGVLLAVPYDVNKPYESISFFVLTNPVAALFRNMHFWSAQFFLIATLFHIYDHFNRRKPIKAKYLLWLRLSLAFLIVFLAMISGFILKGDSDAMQAEQIFGKLIGLVPFVGNTLQNTFVGNGDSLQLVYVHHIATFTLFIVIIVLEHARTFWPTLKVSLVSVFMVLFVSVFVAAPLHDGLNPVIKGPWYFVGFQEILHMLSHPAYALLFVLSVLVLLFFVPFSGRLTWLLKRLLLVLAVIYLLFTAIGYFFRGENWQWQWPTGIFYSYEVGNMPQGVHPVSLFDAVPENLPQVVLGRNEGCLVCHSEMTGFSASHNPQAVGCYACHGGNPFSVDKDEAHSGMRIIPGNLIDAKISCGTSQCHPDITSRINTGLMATLSGMISVDRFVFDEINTPDALTSVDELTDSPADEHLKNFCVRCHLGNSKTETGPITEQSRGGGCLACHLNYQDFERDAAFFDPNAVGDTNYLKIHPSIDLHVSDNHCFGCHSRSGRIATNYEGWHETTLEASEMPNDSLFRLIEDVRVFTYVGQDVHHKLGLNCIDCHNSYELMGDGAFYAHEEQQVNVGCGDCHRSRSGNMVAFLQLDRESALIAALRFENVGERVFLTTADKGRALINTEVRDDSMFMYGKNTGKPFVLSPPHPACNQGKAHDALTCSACHSAWAPSCIGCHNAYDQQEPGYDMLKNKEKLGSWVEYIGEYNAHLPALGRRKTKTSEQIIPVVPGMVLSIDLASFTKSKHDSLLFRRLFAPSAPHTTSSGGRTCVSCHNDPVALGYGKGKLTFISDGNVGRWEFAPYYQDNAHDGLPEDAWVGFLDDRAGEVVSTRSDVFPFSVDQQKKILTVGACLTCHQETSQVMVSGLYNFDSLIEVRSKRCVIPAW